MDQTKKHSRITEEYWAMPVSVSSDGSRLVSLREYVDPQVSRIAIEELTLEQRANVTVARIEMVSHCEIATLNVGVIGKERAIMEVRSRTALGKNLIEIERRVIKFQLERVLSDSKSQ